MLSVTSKGSGDYQLQQIPPATYAVTVTAPGFGSQTKVAELLVNQPATIDFTLSPAGTDVVGECHRWQRTDAQHDGRVDRQLDQQRDDPGAAE